MSLEAKSKFHRKAQLERAPRAKHTISVASRQTKFGIIGSLNTTAPVKLAERQTKARHVSRTVFRRPASSEGQRPLERRVTCDRDLVWTPDGDEPVTPEMQSSSPSAFGGSPVLSETSIKQPPSNGNGSLPLDVEILLDEQSQQSATHWSLDSGGLERENGQGLQSGRVDVLGGTERKEIRIDDQLPVPQGDGGRILAGGDSRGSLISSASSYSDTALQALDHQMLAESDQSLDSLQMTTPRSVHTSSLLLINQDDGEDQALRQDQGDGSDGISSLVFAETASASGSQSEQRDEQAMVEVEKDSKEGKKRDNTPTTGSAPPAVRPPSDENVASGKSDLVVSGVCDRWFLFLPLLSFSR